MSVGNVARVSFLGLVPESNYFIRVATLRRERIEIVPKSSS